MKKLSISILSILVFIGTNISAQSPYQLNWKKELAFSGIGLGIVGLGAYQRSQTPLYTLSDLELLNASSINGFDKNAIHNYSLNAHHASDVFWYSSLSAPLWFLAGKKTRKDFGIIAALWGETMVISAGLTLLTKYTRSEKRDLMSIIAMRLRQKNLRPMLKALFSQDILL